MNDRGREGRLPMRLDWSLIVERSRPVPLWLVLWDWIRNELL